ncbi:GATOR complex protein MIOS-like [Actinia tenebrosa]|uniref:GATOR complex protein MIOS-like n=1 Tax=Actinia tenebrosa TaxID=6105 RepID=A0A6P8INQ0_ACTTE|nr:GATOR complex protein MIOS-like [Actinia tenebrosa]
MKPQVLWSPHSPDRFITFGKDIRLYKSVTSQENSRGQVLQLSDKSHALLSSVINDDQLLKCIAWYPHTEPDDLLAIGQSNGRVIVTSFANENIQSDCGLRREFVPRHPRQCNSLAWNPVASNLLAAGLDKVRNDVSLMVWDINVQLTVRDISGQEKPSRHSTVQSGKQSPIMGPGISESTTIGNRPLAELATSEPTLSLAWFPREHNCLIAGQAQKYLRVFDLRDTSKPHSAAVTKAVYGVSVDPHIEHRVASFSEGPPGIVCIWDIRNFEKPLMTLAQPSNIITNLAWSPTRFGLLSTIARDSSVVQLYDIQHAQLGSSAYNSYELDASVIERSAKSSKTDISSFSWHPTHENRMLTISSNGSLSDFTIFERISVAWSPSSQLTFGCGKHLLDCTQDPPEPLSDEEDISFLMKKRAIAGYGVDLIQLDEISNVIQDPKVLKLWSWYHQVERLRNQGKRKGFNFYGIKTVISGETSQGGVCSKSKIEQSYQEQRLRAKVYCSEERQTALSLCGWDFGEVNGTLADFLKQLQMKGMYERAATIALFNNDIRQAIDILSAASKAATTNPNHNSKVPGMVFNMVAMALSGYTVEKEALWRQMCRKLCSEIESPYLRAAFTFLTTEDGNFDNILNESRIEVEDRVAFACKFLPDNKLASYINNLTAKMIEKGDLNGILLTGMTQDCVDLLEKYVNRTTDIQTASLIIINSSPNIPPEIAKDSRVNTWIQSYRNLLDMWRLWHQRAKLDIHYSLRDNSLKPPQQVFVTCNFCGNSILSSSGPSDSRPRKIAQYNNPSNRPKVMGCPGCRKPLPRCSLCLVHMGTPSTLPQKPPNIDLNAEKPKTVRSINQFSNWFTWCQSCRHGGHANHIIDWFREHSECPVTSCPCHCMKLDSVAMATPTEGADSTKSSPVLSTKEKQPSLTQH